MKKLACLFSIVLLFTACNESKTVKFSGTFSGERFKASDTLYLFGVETGHFAVQDTLLIDESGFTVTIAVNEPSIFAIGKKYPENQCYLVPGDEVILDFEDTDYKIIQSDNIASMQHFHDWKGFLNEYNKSIGRYTDNLNTEYKKLVNFPVGLTKFLQNIPNNETYRNFFKNLSTLDQENLYLRVLTNPIMRFPAKEDLPVFYRNLYEDHKYVNKALQRYPMGLVLAKSYLRFALNYTYDYSNHPSNHDYTEIFLKELKNLGSEELAAELALEELVNRKLFGEIFLKKQKLYGPLLKTEDQIKKVEEYIAENITPYQPGTPAPNFEFQDTDGNIVTLEDLRGKNIYIDVWATWCIPCKYQIPFLETVYEEFHSDDLIFISVSIDKDKDKWEDFIAADPHPWMQLYAGGEWYTKNQDFFDFYKITGIPRFILIDKAGKLIMYDAYRPSEEDLKEKFEQLNL
ncbi:TlpA family protein disulfide reductase [Robertkochia solimangrovi]|uniref:TlpA family protein disulfide reductase n=1 Tax=Robertkochia solimangrovi TaxID=2213046 RepID=UPI0013A58C1D|nr:TlpA disulfide reductase family protein [Robertkochia solimangrovi]